MNRFFSESLLILAVLVFIISLFLPGLTIARPNLQNVNEKNSTCSVLQNPAFICFYYAQGDHTIAKGLECQESTNMAEIETRYPGEVPVPQADINAYCADAQNPTIQSTSTEPGWFILAFGFLGGYGDAASIGMFAWYANIIALIGFIFAITKKYKNAMVFFFISILVGLLTFEYHKVPINEGGVGLPVVGPAIGFYVWEASFVLFLLYAILRYMQSRVKSEA